MKGAQDSLTARTFSRADYFFAMGFGSGLSPWAPGTLGSLLAIVLFIPVVGAPWWFHLLLIVTAFCAGIFLCGRVAADLGVEDPSEIVWDEFVGMWISLLLVPFVWYWWLLAFVLFRVFDILKPWPVRWAERILPGGLGVMCDDVLAGLYALGGVHFAVLLCGEAARSLSG